MGILSVTKARFNNSNRKKIVLVKVFDPLHDVFAQSCFKLLRCIEGNESDQIALRINTLGLFYRVSSLICDDFRSAHFARYLESELEGFSKLASQFEAIEGYAQTIAKTLHLMQERRTNYKREAIAASLSRFRSEEKPTLLERGHKWRTLDLEPKAFLHHDYSTISFDSAEKNPMRTVFLSMSPAHLSKNLQKDLFFDGLAEQLVVFLYGKEKLRLPEIPVFVASTESNDTPLIPLPEVTADKFVMQGDDLLEDPSEVVALEQDGYPTNSVRVLRVLLISNEEVYLRPWDYVWCDDRGHLSHMPAADMLEGMRLLLRSDYKLDKPEEYLDRSEVWRTPLRNIVNLGVSCDILARGIEHRAGVTVNPRMVRSWIDGSVLGPEDLGVFLHLVEELKVRGYMERSIDDEEVQSWWNDLVHARSDQTSKGVKNRAEMLKEAELALVQDIQNNGSASSVFEFSEVLVIDRIWVESTRSDWLGMSNHRNMRVFS